VGRRYGGILGLLAFLAVAARGVLHGTPAEETLHQAWPAMAVFALLGLAGGRLAAWIVDDALRTQVVRELAQRNPTGTAGQARDAGGS